MFSLLARHLDTWTPANELRRAEELVAEGRRIVQQTEGPHSLCFEGLRGFIDGLPKPDFAVRGEPAAL